MQNPQGLAGGRHEALDALAQVLKPLATATIAALAGSRRQQRRPAAAATRSAAASPSRWQRQRRLSAAAPDAATSAEVAHCHRRCQQRSVCRRQGHYSGGGGAGIGGHDRHGVAKLLPARATARRAPRHGAHGRIQPVHICPQAAHLAPEAINLVTGLAGICAKLYVDRLLLKALGVAHRCSNLFIQRRSIAVEPQYG